MTEPVKGASIQKHLDIKEIRDGVVILKNGDLRAILMTSSFNFALKSTEEQDAVIYRYQEFLNSLDFPIQIVVISRKFDIDPYLHTIEQKQIQQKNELLKIQTAEYIDFVRGLSEMSNVMTESFYLVIPHQKPPTQKIGFLGKLFGKKQTKTVEQKRFEELKMNLWQRVEFVITGLQAIGVKAVPLESDELVELFYKLYNPSAKERPELQKATELRLE